MIFSRNYLLLAVSLIVTGCAMKMSAQTPCCAVTAVASTSPGVEIRGPLAISPTGSCFALAALPSNIFPYSIDSSCTTPMELHGVIPPIVAEVLTYSNDGSCLGAAGGATSTGGGSFTVNSDCSLGSFRFYGFGPQAIAYSSQNCLGMVERGDLSFSPLGSDCQPQAPVSLSNFPVVGPDYIQAAFSPDGSCFVAINNTPDTNNVCAIGVNACAAVAGSANCVDSPAIPTSMAFSPNGCFVVTSSNGSVSTFVLEFDCGLFLLSTAELGLDNPFQASFSPDGSCIAIAFQGSRSGGVNIYSSNAECGVGELMQSLTFVNPVKGAGFTSNGCLIIITSTEIHTYSLTGINFVPGFPQVTNLLCHGDNTGSISVEITGGGPMYTYVLHGVNTGHLVIVGPTTSTSEIFSNLPADTYSLTVNNCVLSDSIVVTQPAPLVVNVNPQSATICQGTSQLFTSSVSGGTPNYSYSWSPGGTTPTDPSTTITGATVGTTPVSLTVTDANNCITTADASLVVSPCTNLVISKTACQKDDKVVFTITVTNNDLSTVTGIRVDDMLPEGLRICNVYGDGWTSITSGQFVTAIYELGVDVNQSTQELFIEARIHCKNEILVNCARVSTVLDPNVPINVASAAIKCKSDCK